MEWGRIRGVSGRDKRAEGEGSTKREQIFRNALD
jgi:hypothetical protein